MTELYGSMHPYDANIFAQGSLRLSDVETLHCAVSDRSKVVLVATVGRGVSENTRPTFGRRNSVLEQNIPTCMLATTRLLLPSPLYFQSSVNVVMLIINETPFLQHENRMSCGTVSHITCA